MNHPLLSILIANYNNGKFFKDCYNSLIQQTEKNWEAIIIDDCSTDNSIEIIKNLIENDSRFIFFKNEKNIGYQKTLLKAIENSNSNVFGRLDPDDALVKNAIEISIKTHKEFPEVGLVYSNYISCDENLNKKNIAKGIQPEAHNKYFFNLNWEIGHFATFKKEIYNKTSGFDVYNKRAEDQDIYFKMYEVAPVKYINENLHLYRLHKGGASSFSNGEKAFFWHWVAIIKAAERRGINIEDYFLSKFMRIDKYKDFEKIVKKSNLFKILYKTGMFKYF